MTRRKRHKRKLLDVEALSDADIERMAKYLLLSRPKKFNSAASTNCKKRYLSMRAYEQMNKYHLIRLGWTFEWIRSRSCLGKCYGHARIIALSETHLSNVKDFRLEDWEDCILHEIAHALDFEFTGGLDHGDDWRCWCMVVGAIPNRHGRD